MEQVGIKEAKRYTTKQICELVPMSIWRLQYLIRTKQINPSYPSKVISYSHHFSEKDLQLIKEYNQKFSHFKRSKDFEKNPKATQREFNGN